MTSAERFRRRRARCRPSRCSRSSPRRRHRSRARCRCTRAPRAGCSTGSSPTAGLTRSRGPRSGCTRRRCGSSRWPRSWRSATPLAPRRRRSSGGCTTRPGRPRTSLIPSYRSALCLVHRAGGADARPQLRELVPAHATAGGKVLLAFRDAWRESVLAGVLERPDRADDRRAGRAARRGRGDPRAGPRRRGRRVRAGRPGRRRSRVRSAGGERVGGARPRGPGGRLRPRADQRRSPSW